MPSGEKHERALVVMRVLAGFVWLRASFSADAITVGAACAAALKSRRPCYSCQLQGIHGGSFRTRIAEDKCRPEALALLLDDSRCLIVLSEILCWCSSEQRCDAYMSVEMYFGLLLCD